MNLSIYAGATMVLLPKFSAAEVVKNIQRYHPRPSLAFPPCTSPSCERRRNMPMPCVRSSCISGAAPLPAKVQEEFERMSGGKLVEGYGMTEAAPVTHCNPLTDNCRNGTVGLPLPNVEAMIMDSLTGEALPPGEIGEIMVRGPNVMAGYWQKPARPRPSSTMAGCTRATWARWILRATSPSPTAARI